jgi:hypothetical protein
LITHLYHAFGAWIESAIELPWLAATERPVGFAPADVTLCHNDAIPSAKELQSTAPLVYRSRHTLPDGEPMLIAHRHEDGIVMQFGEGFRFAIHDDWIGVHMTDPAQHHDVQLQLLGPVLAFWQEQRGALALHASAIVVHGVALSFTANSRAGKSTLAAAFVQAGASLLSDDILPCKVEGARVVALPGFPSMRLWPAEAGHFIGDLSGLDFVHHGIDKRRADVGDGVLGQFHDAPTPLACIYVPERHDDAGSPRIEITQLGRSEAMVELARLSFVARLTQAAQSPGAHFDLLAHIARMVPVKRLRYPSGYAHLPAVRAAVLEDMV